MSFLLRVGMVKPIEALGGTLEVVAHFPDGDVRIRDGGRAA